MKIKDLQQRLLYPGQLSFRIEGQIKSFPHKKKLKEFIVTKPVLHEILKANTYSQDYSAKLSFRIEGQIKSFPDKKYLREFITYKPLLQEMLKGLL